MRRTNLMTALSLFCISTLLLSSLLAASASAQTKKRAKPKKRAVPPAFRSVTDVPGLPRALILGDSISIGYTVALQEELKGKVNVHRPATNCGPTTRGLESIDEWLGDSKWDVIHFNWGLHDLKYMGPNGKNLADPKAANSFQQVPPDQYEANLQKLVARMKKTGAKLIWCATTPVPEGAQGRVVGDSVKYNKIAAKVMQEQGVAIDDLYSVAFPQLAKIQRPANVHFSSEGSAALAKKVAESILAELKK